MSQNEYLRGQADVAHLDPLAVVALRSCAICVVDDLSKPCRQPFACRCVASFPLILYSVHRRKAAIFFRADRREVKSLDIRQLGDSTGSKNTDRSPGVD